MHVTAVLLAAGSSRRFGAPKLLAAWRGRPLWEHALAALLAAPAVSETLVVVAPGFAPPLPSRCRLVVNPDPDEGMGGSLRVGVRAASAATEAFMVALADMPCVPPGLIGELVACYRAGERPIVVPVHRGRRGHPVLIGAALRGELEALRGDVGARAVLAAHAEGIATVATEDPGVGFDVDVPDDLEAGGRA